MKIGVATLGDRPVTLGATESPQELALAAEHTRFLAPVEVAVKITRMQEEVLVEGKARTRATLECSRCLEDVPADMAGEFEALYVPEGGAYSARAGRRDFEWGDQRVNFYTDFTVDLADEIRQCILIELPMKPLCRPDCAGLCPNCGKNLNEGPCGCKRDAEEDVWDRLRALLPPKKPE